MNTYYRIDVRLVITDGPCSSGEVTFHGLPDYRHTLAKRTVKLPNNTRINTSVLATLSFTPLSVFTTLAIEIEIILCTAFFQFISNRLPMGMVQVLILYS